MQLNFKDLSPNQCYGAMTQALVPRPIAWVLSDNGDNSYNAAPFSFFTGICSDPPLLMLSVGKKSADEEKDTCLNIRERKNFVVHIPSTRHIESVNKTSTSLDHGESEIDLAELELVNIEGFPLPQIKGCDIAMACKLHRIDEIGNTPQAVIYGEIISLIVSNELLIPNEKKRLQIDGQKLDPLARLGGNHYTAIGKTLTANRPK